MRYCGLNIGYGYTKMHKDASYFQIASVVERARTQNMGGVSLVRETVPVKNRVYWCIRDRFTPIVLKR